MIAISYRREDSLPIAGRLYDRLQAKFGKENVFMDFDSIPPGVDFREQIKQTIERSNLVIAMIGPHWLGERSDGSRRIDDPTDFVRLEIEYALQGGIPVIPLLINNTPMPKPEKLPPTIERIAFRNALPLDSGLDFHSHAERLISSVSAKVGPGKIDESTPSSHPWSPRTKLRTTFMFLAIGLGIGLITWYFIPKRNSVDESSKPTPTAARESENGVTAPTPLPGNLESTEQSPKGDIRVEYRRDLAGNSDLPGFVWLISTSNEAKRLLLYRYERGAQVIFSPDEQWLVVNDAHGSGQSTAQLFRRARADDIAYVVPTEVAGHNRPLGILAWCFYWRELGGDTGICDTNDPHHVYIHARAWRSNSTAVMLKIARGGSESTYNATTPYECWYDVNNQKFQSITNIDALRSEIEQARARETPSPSAKPTIAPTLPTNSSVEALATQTPSPSRNAKNLFGGRWEGKGDVQDRSGFTTEWSLVIEISEDENDIALYAGRHRNRPTYHSSPWQQTSNTLSWDYSGPANLREPTAGQVMGSCTLTIDSEGKSGMLTLAESLPQGNAGIYPLKVEGLVRKVR